MDVATIHHALQALNEELVRLDARGEISNEKR